MPSQLRAQQAEQVKKNSSGALPESVDGMSQEDIIAAAAAAAAVSGYCEPQGLASLVGKTVQVWSSSSHPRWCSTAVLIPNIINMLLVQARQL